jgi:hypothetical protein
MGCRSTFPAFLSVGRGILRSDPSSIDDSFGKEMPMENARPWWMDDPELKALSERASPNSSAPSTSPTRHVSRTRSRCRRVLQRCGKPRTIGRARRAGRRARPVQGCCPGGPHHWVVVDRDREIARRVQAASAPPVPRPSCRLEQFLQRNREIRDASSRRVEDRIGDRRRHPDDDQLTETLHTEGVGDRVLGR